jgi:hypothetical protein
MLSSTTIWRKVMTKKTRRRYTAEFNAAAVARLDETGETLSSVAKALGVAATQVKTLYGAFGVKSVVVPPLFWPRFVSAEYAVAACMAIS